MIPGYRLVPSYSDNTPLLKENLMPVTKSNRALLVVSNLTKLGRSDLKWLHQFLDGAGIDLAERLMGPQYGKVEKLVGSQATKNGFITAVSSLGSNQAVRAIDVIVNLHGANNELFFEDGGVSTSSLKNDLLSAQPRKQAATLIFDSLLWSQSRGRLRRGRV